MKNFLRVPKTAAKVHAALAAVWLLLIFPTILFWKDSILWVSLMSCYALFAAHLASYQSAEGAGVDEATRLKLNAIADALAHFMEHSDNHADYLQAYVDELRRTVGIEDRPEYDEVREDPIDKKVVGKA